jgi:hypothetical protein
MSIVDLSKKMRLKAQGQVIYPETVSDSSDGYSGTDFGRSRKPNTSQAFSGSTNVLRFLQRTQPLKLLKQFAVTLRDSNRS